MRLLVTLIQIYFRFVFRDLKLLQTNQILDIDLHQRNEASFEISKMLGHTSIKTTLCMAICCNFRLCFLKSNKTFLR